jgi:dihydropteroate synthase type 2
LSIIAEDSFSDGGRFLASEAAIAQVEKLLNDGADIVDLRPRAIQMGSR